MVDSVFDYTVEILILFILALCWETEDRHKNTEISYQNNR